MDLSPLIALAGPLAGCVLAARCGLSAAGAARPAYAAAALGVALALGLGLTFVQSALHTLCIENLHLCTQRGDRNMSYWLQSLLATPVFWLAGWVAWRARRAG